MFELLVHLSDLPPGRPSFITIILLIYSVRFGVGQARRARRRQFAQALGVRTCRESCGNSRAAPSGHVNVRFLRRRGEEASVQGGEAGYSMRRPYASGSGRRRAAPRAASARSWHRAAPAPASLRRSTASKSCLGTGRPKTIGIAPTPDGYEPFVSYAFAATSHGKVFWVKRHADETELTLDKSSTVCFPPFTSLH